MKKATRRRPFSIESLRLKSDYAFFVRCFEMCFCISNIVTTFLLLKMGFRISSALMFWRSWRPFFLMYFQSFETTSWRGSGAAPTTIASCALGVYGALRAGFSVRFFFGPADFFVAFAPAAFFVAFLAVAFFAVVFFAAFFVAFFFAILNLPFPTRLLVFPLFPQGNNALEEGLSRVRGLMMNRVQRACPKKNAGKIDFFRVLP